MLSFNFDTPLEEHICGETEVYVKRDDLLNGNMDLPPWAKMEGIRRVLENGELSKDKPIIHLSVRVSYSGWALAYIGKELGFKIKIAYPDTKDYPQKALEKIESLGAELVPMKPNILSIVISSVANLAKKENYQMMPYAFNHIDYINYFKERTQSIMQKKNFKHLVINAGSGVTPSGILQGFMNFDSFGIQSEENKKYAHLITTASKSSIASMLKKWNVYDRNQTQIHETPHDFFDDMDWCETPFPCNGNWDKKAWMWLKENGCKLNGDILFYNLGGACASHFWRQ